MNHYYNKNYNICNKILNQIKNIMIELDIKQLQIINKNKNI